MDYDFAVKTINRLLIKNQPSTFNSSWIRGCAPHIYRFFQKNIRSEISSSVLVKGYIYGMDGKTDYPPHSLRCIDWKTGELMWEHKMRMGTLIAAGDKLIILEYDGTLHIAEATPLIYKEISVVKVDEGACQFWTPPVLYKGKIFCRNHSHNLICIDVSK